MIKVIGDTCGKALKFNLPNINLLKNNKMYYLFSISFVDNCQDLIGFISLWKFFDSLPISSVKICISTK
jgi:hypothetical protein